MLAPKTRDAYLYDPDRKLTLLGSITTGDQTFLFQGGRYDLLTLTYHFGPRVYAPSLGTWVQRDPAGYVNGADVYQITEDNPLAFRDPNGMDVTLEENENDQLGTMAGTHVKSGIMHVRLIRCSNGQVTTRPTTIPATQRDCVAARDVYDHLIIETLFASTNKILEKGGVDPKKATDVQKRRAQSEQDKAVRFEHDNWQIGLASAWNVEAGGFRSKVLAISQGPEADVRKSVQKEFDAMGVRISERWQKLEDSDAAQRKGPPRRPDWGAGQWKKIQLVVDFKDEKP